MADIGEKLSEARKAKGMSISDVEKITKIQSRYLTAIEENDYDKLPGDFYVRAFIRQYANVVGLDGKKLLESYKQEVPEAKPDEYVEDSIDNQTEKVKQTTQNKKGMWQAYLPKALGIIGAVVVIMLIYLVFSHFFGGSQQEAENKSNNVTVSQTAPKKKKKTTTVKKTSSVKIEKVSAGVYRVTGLKSNRKLTVSTNDSTWAQVTAGSSKTWSNSLAAGDKHSMTIPHGTKQVVVNFGNANSATIKIAGKRVPFTRTSGSLRITLLIGSTAEATDSTTSSSTGSDTTADTNTSSNTTSSQQNQSNQTTQQTTQNSTNNSTTNSNQTTTGGNYQSSNQTTTAGTGQTTTGQGTTSNNQTSGGQSSR
ncbi:MAG: DUF4115 domain-containing protein [Lactobacillus sp.]|jgi:cytoskeletal protein RodZ|nr:DUF4115 domain-containing protein [Lactobacillus sp.]